MKRPLLLCLLLKRDAHSRCAQVIQGKYLVKFLDFSSSFVFIKQRVFLGIAPSFSRSRSSSEDQVGRVGVNSWKFRSAITVCSWLCRLTTVQLSCPSVLETLRCGVTECVAVMPELGLGTIACIAK